MDGSSVCLRPRQEGPLAWVSCYRGSCADLPQPCLLSWGTEPSVPRRHGQDLHPTLRILKIPDYVGLHGLILPLIADFATCVFALSLGTSVCRHMGRAWTCGLECLMHTCEVPCGSRKSQKCEEKWSPLYLAPDVHSFCQKTSLSESLKNELLWLILNYYIHRKPKRTGFREIILVTQKWYSGMVTHIISVAKVFQEYTHIQ